MREPEQSVPVAKESAEESADDKLLETTVLKGYELIYSDSGIKELVSSKVNKVINVANAAYMVAKKIIRSEEQAGRPAIPDRVLAVAGYHITDKIIELAEHQGIDFTPEEEKAALQKAYQMYIEDGIRDRTINPVELAQAVDKTPEGRGKIAAGLAEIPDLATGGGASAAGSASTPTAAPPSTQPPAAAPPSAQPPTTGGALSQGRVGAAQQPNKSAGLLSGPSPLERFLR